MRRYTPLVLLAVIPLILSSCWKKDTPEPVDNSTVSSGSVKSAYTREEIESMMTEVANKPLDINSGSVTTRDINSHLHSDIRNIRELIDSLTGSDSASVTKRSYLRSYMGDYSGALAERDALCKADVSKCPEPSITLEVDAAVDQDGNQISNPSIYLNGQSITMESSIAQPPVYGEMIHRVRVEAEGYLDSYAKLNDTGTGGYKILAIQPTMAKADKSIEMDNQAGGTYATGDGTGAITYTIAPDTFTTRDGKKVTGKVNLYLFALDKGENNLSAFQLDIFSASGENLGGSMVTDGMPFVTAYQDGQELKIAKPIDGVGQIGPSEFKLDYEGVPKNTWLNNSELAKHGFPGYWRLDRDAGVWVESKMQILDTAGRYRFLFL